METKPTCPISETVITSHVQHRPIPIRRIARFLRNQYGDFVTIEDVAKKPENEQIDTLLTRALAAHAVAVYTKKEPDEAAQCVVDGGQDLGIDAIAFDDVEKCCWLFQSKIQYSGHGSMAWSDMLKFLEGFDAIASDQLEGANRRILALAPAINRAVMEPGWRFALVLASTSVQPLGDESVKEVESRLAYQDPGNSGTFTFTLFSLNAVSESLEHALDSAKIDLEIELHNWGCVATPFTSYYGQVSLDAVTKWRKHGQPLFSKNLRGFMKSSQVSESISRTLGSQSELFWYFNNGATMLCQKIERRGPYSSHESRERGFFQCYGVSIVNGAQTIGTIWDQPGDGESLDPNGMMPLRLISLEKAPSDFAEHVTKATNTQKNILARDFATLDPVQRRIAREFQMEGRVYVYRQGDILTDRKKGCDLDELSQALACARSVEHAVIAYRNAGFLLDPEHAFYKDIFGHPGPSSEEAWLCVKLLRASEKALKEIRSESTTSKQKQVSTHGSRYMYHRIMNDPSVKKLRGVRVLADEDLENTVKTVARRQFDLVTNYIKTNHEREYLQVVFKNTTKVTKMHKDLAKAVLPEPEPPPEPEPQPVPAPQPDLFSETKDGET